MKHLLIAAAALSFALNAHAEVRGKEVDYHAGKLVMKGYLAWDDAIKGKRPGILVVHEWWGHNEYARKRARMLAELGYTALAVDMYGNGQQAEHPKEAGEFMNQVFASADHGRARFEAAMKALKSQPTVDARDIGAIGYCFGGAVVLNMARSGLDLKAVASFHGALGTQTPAQPGKVKAKIRVFTGADDKMIPPAQVAAFKEEMARAGVDFQVTEYPGAMHAFTNPDADALGKKFDMPIAYNATADQDSWQQATAFLKATLMPAK